MVSLFHRATINNCHLATVSQNKMELRSTNEPGKITHSIFFPDRDS